MNEGHYLELVCRNISYNQVLGYIKTPLVAFF